MYIYIYIHMYICVYSCTREYTYMSFACLFRFHNPCRGPDPEGDKSGRGSRALLGCVSVSQFKVSGIPFREKSGFPGRVAARW